MKTALNVSNTVLLSLLPTHFPVDFCSWNHPIYSWGSPQRPFLRIEESDRCREVTVGEVMAFRGRGTTVYSVRSIWHNIDSDSVPPQITSVRYISYSSTCHLLSSQSNDMVENGEQRLQSEWLLLYFADKLLNISLQKTLHKKYWANKILFAVFVLFPGVVI